MVRDSPDRYVATVAKAQRRGRILVDWLRNRLGSTAVASFSPRARPGATVATPLAWREVTASLDPQRFTIATVPDRLRRQRADPWDSFAARARPLPADAFPAPSGPAPSDAPRRQPAARAPGTGRATLRETPAALKRRR